MTLGAWQVISDCEACKTTGSVTEMLDATHPACHLGVPVTSECQMCGNSIRALQPDFAVRDALEARRCPACRKVLDEASRTAHTCAECGYRPEVQHTEGVNVRDRATAQRALERWGIEEGMTPEELCESSLGGSLEAVLDRYEAGEAVESSFDAIAFLFPSMAAGGGIGVLADHTQEVLTPSRPLPPLDVRAPVKLLVSVMVADGEIRAGERAFLDGFLADEQLDPIAHEELRPWRPHEVGRIADSALAERSLKAAVELMHLDGERDGSEFRIVRTFARSWGVPESKVKEWNVAYERRYTPRLQFLWRGLSRWVRTR